MSDSPVRPSGSGAHPGSEAKPSLLRFGVFEIDLRTSELRKRGVRVRLQRQPFKVLVRLASAGGDLVTRDALQSELWGGDTFVDFDQGLNFCVKQIRTALGDDAQNPRYVETLPRQGYRFVAPVSRGAEVLKLVQGGAGARDEAPRSGPSERSVAVLPFSDLSPERNQAYFCEGIAEEILTALRRVERLKVASRACSFRFHSTDVDVREIGRELGVSTLLDGSVRKAGTRLRITVELVDAGDGFRIWSESYDRELRDVFEIQEEIARSVAQALEITLSKQESGALGKRATEDILAYDCYLRGRQRYYEYHRRSIESARELFSRAIERDPRFARAHAGLADCHSYLFTHVGREAAHLASARASAEKALALDPDLAEAHASLGTALSLAGHHVEAEAAFEAAIRLAPRLFEAHYFYARDCFIRGELQAAAAHYEEAMRVWPDDYQSPLLVAQVYEDLGRPGDAAASRRKGVAVVEERLRTSPEDARALYMGANGLVALGERERGLEWVERALALDSGDPMLLYNVACIQCLAGDDEAALSSLERAFEAGMTAREWLEQDSNLDPIRDTPRFRALLERKPAR